MNNLPSKWREVSADDDTKTLIGIYQVKSLAEAFAKLDKLRNLVINNSSNADISVSISSDMLTVSIHRIEKDKMNEAKNISHEVDSHIK